MKLHRRWRSWLALSPLSLLVACSSPASHNDAAPPDDAAMSGDLAIANDAAPALDAGDDGSGPPLTSTVRQFQAFPDGGQVECNTTGTMCVWATTQSAPAPFTGSSELAACPVSYSTGTPVCMAAPTCLTCGQDEALFKYGSVAQKGQPRWFPDGTHLAFWVGNPGLVATGLACSHTTPGAGCNGDLWTATITGTTTPAIDATSTVQWTHEAAGSGVLFPTLNASYVAYSERFNDGDGSAPQSLGCWQVHVLNYQITSGNVAIGAEIAGSPFNVAGTGANACVWTEGSGFFDAASGQLVVTANAPTAPWWQPSLYAINLTSGTSSLFFESTAADGCPWNEHVHVDPSGNYVTWASSYGTNGFGGYDGCKTTGFPGNPPLELYRAKIARAGSGAHGDDQSGSERSQAGDVLQLDRLRRSRGRLRLARHL